MGKDWPQESYRDRSYNSGGDYEDYSTANDNYVDKRRNFGSTSNSGGRRSSDYHHHHHHRNQDDGQYADDSSYSGYGNRHRSHRIRSRSRSPSEREGRNNYDSDHSGGGYYQHDDRHHYDSRSYYNNREKKPEVPNNTLMIRNIPFHFTDKDVMDEINKLGYYPKDVRLMKNKETGQSRGFGFIEFASVEEATQIKEQNEGFLYMENGEQKCSLHYSFPKEGFSAGPKDDSTKTDWCCTKCGINNFKRRDECFKCFTRREESQLYENSVHPQKIQPRTNVLSLKNLAKMTTEETVLYKLGTITRMPIKSLRLMPDPENPQTNVCLVELHTVHEATDLYQTITAMPNGLVIDKYVVTLSYGQRIDQMNQQMMAAALPVATQNAAMAALAAAQWKNREDTKNRANLGTVTLNGVKYKKFPAPDYNSFQYDATSGFYYDASTGFYYDSNSQYFYNSSNQQYMYYDTTNQVYITVDSTGNAATATAEPAGGETETSKSEPSDEKMDKAKLAKKIAKDMEKWAKTLNSTQKQLQTPISKPTNVFDSPQQPEVESASSSNVSYYLMEKQPLTTRASATVDSSDGAQPNDDGKVAASGGDPFEIIKKEEERLIDRNRLACLLCKRQFNTAELLTKHQQLSGLHKTNLSVLRQTLLSQDQIEHMEKVERELAYRDRAKERRDKYGLDDSAEYPKRKFEPEKESPIPSSETLPPPPPISGDNIGSRMLKAMGWTEGTGLGKSNQGMSDIIQVERRKSGLGLGSQNATVTNAKSYKDAVRRTALQRFKEMNEQPPPSLS